MDELCGWVFVFKHCMIGNDGVKLVFQTYSESSEILTAFQTHILTLSSLHFANSPAFGLTTCSCNPNGFSIILLVTKFVKSMSSTTSGTCFLGEMKLFTKELTLPN